MTVCAQKRKKTANTEDSLNNDIEPFVAHLWEDVTQQHLIGMLEDLESLKYVPVEVRRKAASEPLFLVRYE